METCHNDLPSHIMWPDRPIFIQPINGTSLVGKKDVECVRLGELTPFESPMFKGACLFRLKSVKSAKHQAAQDAYFSGPNTSKMLIQIAVQGRFKEPVHMCDVYSGQEYDTPLPKTPPKFIGKILEKVFKAIVPGLILDLYSARPKVVSRIGGGCYTLSIDAPGDEPDLCADDLPERTMHSCNIRHVPKRKRILSRDRNKSNADNCFQTDLVYTFNNSDEFLDIGDYAVCLPFGKRLDLTKYLDEEHPLGMNVLTEDGRNVYSFKIWHEKLLLKKKKDLMKY